MWSGFPVAILVAILVAVCHIRSLPSCRRCHNSDTRFRSSCYVGIRTLLVVVTWVVVESQWTTVHDTMDRFAHCQTRLVGLTT